MKQSGKYIIGTIMLILIIFISCGTTYLITTNNINKTNPKNCPKCPSNEENNISDKETNIKIDVDKDWAYDALYEKNVLADSYTTTYYETFYAKDIIVPYININSSSANKANQEIKKIFDNLIEFYNESVNNKTSAISDTNYKKISYKNTYSLLLTQKLGSGTDVATPTYYTYNFDAKTGEKLTFEDIYTRAGFTSDNIDKKVESAITNIMQEKLEDYKDSYPDKTNFDTYNNESFNNYKETLKNNTLKYYLTDDGKLNIIVSLSIPVGKGFFDTIINIL